MNEWWMMMRKKSFSDFYENFYKWSSGGINFVVFGKIVTSLFQVGKKSDLVWKFWNFRSKTPTRRGLFFTFEKRGNPFKNEERGNPFKTQHFWKRGNLFTKSKKEGIFLIQFSSPASLARAQASLAPAVTSLTRAVLDSSYA